MTRRLALLALGALLAAFSPLEAEEEHVEEGNARLRAGDPAAALRSYDAAERVVGRRPEIDHDRGNAALAAGRPEEAKAAWRRAAEQAPPALASRALQNLGTALAAEGNRDGALRALTDALSRDPSNEDARWDLEVLLRGGEEKGRPPRDAGARREQTASGGRSEPDRGEGGSASPDARPRPAPARGAEEEAGREPEQRSAAAERAPLSRQEAEALLDALRARERNMPFSGRERRRDGRRADGAKDW